MRYRIIYQVYGNEICNTVNNGVRIGTAVAIVVVLAVLALIVFARRRRIARQQATYGRGQGGIPSGIQQGYYGGSMPQVENQYLPRPQQEAAYQYAPDASNWHQPPPAYIPPPEGKGSQSVQVESQHYYEQPLGPPPNANAGYNV